MEHSVQDEKKRAIAASERTRDREIERIQSRIRILALTLPPVPAFVIGVVVLFMRWKRDREARR